MICGLLIAQISWAQNLTDNQGLKQGTWVKKYDNGKIRYQGAFENDKEVGLFTFFDRNGKKVSTREYTSPGGIARCKMYNFMEYLHASGSMDGRTKIGEWVYFSNKGRDTVTVENFKNGVLDGKQMTYFPNGQLATDITFVDGKKQGAFFNYFNNGQLEQEGTYLDDQLHGSLKIWYRIGKLKRQAYYDNGDKTGKWTFLNPNGGIIKVLNYNKIID